MSDTAAAARALARGNAKYFYFHMMLLCAAIAFLGFLPSYWMPMAAGTLKHEAPVIHIHGMIYFGWSLYIVFQSWLGATGQIVRHRAIGLIGVSLVTAMLIFGFLVVIQTMAENVAAGHPERGINIAATSVINIVLFVILIASALANTRRPDWHKRLMVMAAISILGAPIARWFIVYLHMPPPTTIANWLVVLLAAVPLLRDWQTRGKPHPANTLALTAMILAQLVRAPLAGSQAWHAVAGWLAGLAG